MENCGAVGEKTLRQWTCRTTGRKILSTVDIVGGEGEVRWLVGWREELESCAKSWIWDGNHNAKLTNLFPKGLKG